MVPVKPSQAQRQPVSLSGTDPEKLHQVTVSVFLQLVVLPPSGQKLLQVQSTETWWTVCGGGGGTPATECGQQKSY